MCAVLLLLYISGSGHQDDFPKSDLRGSGMSMHKEMLPVRTQCQRMEMNRPQKGAREVVMMESLPHALGSSYPVG